jgi:hypothetical protein
MKFTLMLLATGMVAVLVGVVTESVGIGAVIAGLAWFALAWRQGISR